MFSAEQLSGIDGKYFNIICADGLDVTIQSRNTGHWWYLHCTDYPIEENCVIFHKYKVSHSYHLHGKAGSLSQAIKSIKKHDIKMLTSRNLAP